jgi:hypothetical protein
LAPKEHDAEFKTRAVTACQQAGSRSLASRWRMNVMALGGNDTSGIISIEVQRHKQSPISEDASRKNDRER